MYRLTIIFFCCLNSMDSSEVPSFVELTTTTARGVVGDELTIPCKVEFQSTSFSEEYSKITWKRLPYGVQETRNKTRISRGSGRYTKSATLRFRALEKEDAGVYSCIFTSWSGEHQISKNFTVTVFDSNEGLRWDSSGNCGVYYPINGLPGECDPEGLYPCCNSQGRCGYNEMQCECSDCTDYRMINSEPYFDKRSPSVARAMIGKDAEIPCAVRNLFSVMDDEGNPLTTVKFERTIRRNGSLETQSIESGDKFDISFVPPFKAYHLAVKSVTKEDEGTYHCSFTIQDKVHTKDIELTILEDNEEFIPWSRSGSCGKFIYWPRGSAYHKNIRQPCDSLGANPCCSSNKICGFFVEDCLCADCMDSRNYDPSENICEEIGQFKCFNAECTNYFSQCDGKVDCSNGLDEQNCEMEETFEDVETSLVAERRNSYSLPCKVSNLSNDSKVLWNTFGNEKRLPEFTTVLTKDNTSYLHFSRVDNIHQRNYSCEIRNSNGAVKWKIFEVNVCNIENPAICKEDGKCIPRSQLCDGVLNCKLGSDEENCPVTRSEGLTSLPKAQSNQCHKPGECITPFSLVGGKCVLTSTSQMNWFEAQTFCIENLGESITFNSVEDVIPFFRTGNYTEILSSKFPAWTGVSGETVWTDRNGVKIQGLFSSVIPRSCIYLTSVKNVSLTQTENCNKNMFALCEKSICKSC